jgi:hypothetical protein
MMRMPFLSLTAAALRNNGFDEPSLQETEQMLADALRNLTVQQRENVIEELHGVSTQAEIQAQDDKLKMMDLYFRLYANDAYRKAERQSKEYVEDPITRLAFLHATEDGGDPVEAAKKMVAYLEQKLILFGEHALCRPITLNDLNDDSMNCLRSGFFQYLGKDNVGRKVVASFPSALVYGDIENHVSQTSVNHHAYMYTYGLESIGRVEMTNTSIWFVGFEKLGFYAKRHLKSLDIHLVLSCLFCLF